MDLFPIQSAKVQRPPLRAATLQRDRLLDWLHVKIHHRVVVVAADAGYGKTTLLADFARRSRIRTLWYRLDEEDGNWVSFVHYLVAAGREADPEFAPRTASLLAELGSGGPNRDTIVETFLHEWPSLVATGPAALIIDDYHLVDDVPDVRQLVRQLIERAPERMTLVFSSRRLPGVPLARVRALGELAELVTDDLRFNAPETEQLFRETFGRPLEADVLDDLRRRTEGWVASLQLVQAALRSRSASDIRTFVRNLNGAQTELYDYLAEEVVGELDERMQQFLMRTSILQVVTADLAMLVADCSASVAADLMDSAERLGMLPRRAEQANDELRYHPLVRDFLEARLRREIGAEGVRALHRRVAEFAEGFSWSLAAHHYAASNDVSDMLRVLTGAVQAIMGKAEYALAESFLDRYPNHDSRPEFDIIVSRMELHRGQMQSALSHARRAVDQSAPTDSSPPTIEGLALANLMTLEFDAGNVDVALDHARQLLIKAQTDTLRLIADCFIKLCLATVDGDLADLSSALSNLARRQRAEGLDHYCGISLLNHAICERARGRAAGALASATQAIDAMTNEAYGLETPFAQIVKGWALAHLGRSAESRAELEAARAKTNDVARGEALYEAADVIGAYLDPELAEGWLQESLLVESGSESRRQVLMLTRAQNLIRLNRFDEANQALAGVVTGEVSSEQAHTARVLTVRAELALASGRSDWRDLAEAAMTHSNRQHGVYWSQIGRCLIALGSDEAQLNAVLGAIGRQDPAYLSVLAHLVGRRLSDIARPVADLILNECRLRPARWRPALRAAIETDSTRGVAKAAELLDDIGEVGDVAVLRALARRLKPTGQYGHLGRGLARALAPRIVVEDLGRVTISIGESNISGADIRRKALALLCFLLTRPSYSATKDQVLDAMWPDVEPTTGLNSLNQTVYFLRRVFDSGYSEDMSAPYLHHDSDVIWLDQEMISSRSGNCRDLLRQLGPSPSYSEVDALAELYLDRFALDFAYEEWAVPFRENLHAAYLEVIEKSVRLDANSGEHDRAMRLARRALEVDPEAQQVETSLLHLYRVTGAHAAAAEQYSHYAQVIREEIGADPPPLESI